MRAPNIGSDVPFGARLRSLDGLRGIAVLSVVAFHTLHIKGAYNGWRGLWIALQGSSWAGVDLFFVLSGFLITGILLDSRERPGYFTKFYARRTLRIFPLYYAVLVVALLILPFAVGLQRLPALYTRLLENQVWLWTYLSNFVQATEAHTLPGFGHFWSLAIEEQFYWFWPLVVFLSSRRILLRLCLATCFFLPLLRLFLLWHGSTPWALRQYTFTRFDTLLYGAIVAIVVRDFKLIQRVLAFVPVVAGISLILIFMIGLRFGYLPFEASESLVVGYSSLGLLFAGMIFSIVTRDHGDNRWLSSAPLEWFGRHSYGIYVFHWPIALFLKNAVERRLLSFHSDVITACSYFAFVLVMSSVAAWISWNYFEAQFLKLKRYFEYSEDKRMLQIESHLDALSEIESKTDGHNRNTVI